jgi:hypothetical protein
VLLQREQESFGAGWLYSKRNRRMQDRGYQQVPLEKALPRVISIADGCLNYDFAWDNPKTLSFQSSNDLRFN